MRRELAEAKGIKGYDTDSEFEDDDMQYEKRYWFNADFSYVM